MALTAGTRVGAYEVIELVGEGGMGEVYRAVDTRLKRDVALKVLPASVAGDPDRLLRFAREAEMLAALNHPNIASIYGVEDAASVRALVMELVDGETLADRIARGPIPIDEALPIASQIAEALEAAHEQGIVHRDLKPANIKLDRDGRVKVLDFGLAKLVEHPATSGANPSTLSMSPTITTPAMTQLGMILGTAAYMSPEQAKGRPADKRSDVWAFGCVLYEMLTGKRAFEGEDVSDTLASVLRAEPDWNALPATPAPITDLLVGTLRKGRTERISDISVAKFLLTRPVAPSIVDQSSKRKMTMLVASAAALGGMLVAAAVAFAMWPTPPPPPAATKFSLTLPDGELFTGTTRHHLAISPDGRRIVYAANFGLRVRSLDQLEARTIAGTEELSPMNPVFSPDGRSVAFYSNVDRTLRRIPVTGGAATLLATLNESPNGSSWADQWIWVGQGAGGIVRVRADEGSRAEQVVTVAADEWAFGPQLIAGTDALLFTVAKRSQAGTIDWNNAQIVAQSLTSKARTVVIPRGSDGRYLASGHIVYAVEGTVFAAPFNVDTLKPDAAAEPVVVGVRRPFSGVTGAAQYAIAQSGTLVYVPGPARGISGSRVFAIAGTTEKPKSLSIPAASFAHPRVDSEGTRVVYTKEDGGTDVWTFELRDPNPKRLTWDGNTRYPVWAPDGKFIAVQSAQDGKSGIFLQAVSGGERRRLTTAGEGEAHIPESISRDGWLLFSLLKGQLYTLAMVRTQGGEVRPFAGIQSTDPIGATFSPDGRLFAYGVSDVSGGVQSANRGVYLQPFPTGPKSQVTKSSLDYHPAWIDGQNIYYIPGGNRGLVRVADAVPGPGRPTRLETIPATGHLSIAPRAYDVLPGGRLLLLLDTATSSDAASPNSMVVVENWFTELQRLVPTK